jgi:phosphoglycolate phosphatase
MFKYVIFDFDGTIADSSEVFISAWNKLAERNSFTPIQSSDLNDLMKVSIKDRAKMMNFPLYKLPIYVPQMYKLYQQSLHDVTLFDGIKEMLTQLKQKNLEVAIISSNSEEIIHEFLERNNITTVGHVMCSSRIFGKDRLLRRFMKERNLNRDEVIYVGDEHRDLVACRKTGIPMIWVAWGFDAPEAMESTKPDYQVSTPSEILQIL